MKWLKKQLNGREKGQVLAIVLILLVLGSLIISPTLSFASTTLVAQRKSVTRAQQLYAADAGIEDAVWKLKQNSNSTGTYTIPTINNNQVQVNISSVGNSTYKIISNATSENSTKTVISYVYMDRGLWDFIHQAVTSPGQVSTNSGTTIDGPVWSPNIDNQGTIIPPPTPASVTSWPVSTTISQFYLDKITITNPPPLTQVNFTTNTTLAGSYFNNLSVKGENNAVLTANGTNNTTYITGDLNFLHKGSSKYAIRLNNNTLFVQGNVNFDPHTITVIGPGCIIALGDINYQPGSQDSPYVFIMSVNGKINFQPNGNFQGSIAGDTSVDLKTGTFTFVPPSPGLIYLVSDSMGLLLTGLLRGFFGAVRRLVQATGVLLLE